jgi:hypothetical protein
MDPCDDYRPDPPQGLGYADYCTARARHFARVSAEAETARLERLFTLAPATPHARRPGEDSHDRTATEPPESCV